MRECSAGMSRGRGRYLPPGAESAAWRLHRRLSRYTQAHAGSSPDGRLVQVRGVVPYPDAVGTPLRPSAITAVCARASWPLAMPSKTRGGAGAPPEIRPRRGRYPLVGTMRTDYALSFLWLRAAQPAATATRLAEACRGCEDAGLTRLAVPLPGRGFGVPPGPHLWDHAPHGARRRCREAIGGRRPPGSRRCQGPRRKGEAVRGRTGSGSCGRHQNVARGDTGRWRGTMRRIIEGLPSSSEVWDAISRSCVRPRPVGVTGFLGRRRGPSVD